MEVELAKLQTQLEDHVRNCLEDRREQNRTMELRNDYIERQRLELWGEIDKLRPMIYKMWGGIIVIPFLVSIGAYFIIK